VCRLPLHRDGWPRESPQELLRFTPPGPDVEDPNQHGVRKAGYVGGTLIRPVEAVVNSDGRDARGQRLLEEATTFDVASRCSSRLPAFFNSRQMSPFSIPRAEHVVP
jgi:hypothetical protein